VRILQQAPAFIAALSPFIWHYCRFTTDTPQLPPLADITFHFLFAASFDTLHRLSLLTIDIFVMLFFSSLHFMFADTDISAFSPSPSMPIWQRVFFADSRFLYHYCARQHFRVE